MSYGKVEAEGMLKERLEKANTLVNETDRAIEKLEKEKLVYLARRDEAAFALSIVKKMRASNVRDPEPEMAAEPAAVIPDGG